MKSILGIVCALFSFAVIARAQNVIPTNDPPQYGPYNAVLLADGEGLKKVLVKDDTVTRADSPWTLYAWIYFDEIPKGISLIAGLGDPESEYSRYLSVDGDNLLLWAG
jgi:hypothetical protein